MVEAAVPDGHGGRADGEAPTVVLAAGAVAQLGGLVDDLVEGGEDVVGELDLGDGSVAHGGYADPEARDALGGDERVTEGRG